MLKKMVLVGVGSFQVLCGEIPQSSLEKFPPMTEIYHPVSTTNQEAQKSFDRGLTYLFAFNHNIAFRAFEKASKLDPNLAMAYWGMALALGQNVNEDVTPENEIRCYNYTQTALKLAPNATPNEQGYIDAIKVRYTNDPSADLVPLRFHYRDAMKKVMEAYPEDLDASTIYAESILDLDPWKWWTPDFKPREGTFEAIDVLDSVLRRNPDHIGANHYYIHAFEESPYPERALMSAHRLETLFPEAGHLLHMPCHIFMQTGDYESARNTDLKAIAQDRKYLEEFGMDSGTYPLHYLSHNIYVLTRIYMLMEDYDNAIKAAFDVKAFVEPYAEHMGFLQNYDIVPLKVYLYFHKWKEILEYTPKSTLPSIQSYWHFSRAVAFASLGDMDSALKEKELMLQFKGRITDQEQIANNPFAKVMDIAEMVLNAVLAKAQNKTDEHISILRKAADAQDQLYYDEPPAWHTSIRQMLGFALLQQKNYVEAEKAFQEVLLHLQRNGRTLYGLTQSLKGQGRALEAYWVEREMTWALRFGKLPNLE